MIKKIVWNLPRTISNNILKLRSNSNYYISNLTTKQANSTIQELPQNKSQVSLKNKSSKLKTISNEGKRIEFQIMTKIQAPNFILEYIETQKYARNIKSYNVHLTNGGEEYEEFPLIKLLSIALKKVQEGNGEISSWKSLEYFIRKRLHRCTIQQNLKLLYIMLKIFPKYTFDYSFILSICLALKKEIDIMSIDELKSLYYVLYTNSNEQKRYNNEILSNIQSIILSKMLQRYRDKLRAQQTKKHTHLPLNNIYSWIALGLSLNLRTNYEQIVYENKIVQLIQHFNLRWQAAFAKEQYNRSISDKEMSSLFVLFCINDSLVKYSEVSMRKSKNQSEIIDFKQIFNAFKLNFLVANSRSVQRMLKNCSYLQGLKAFRSLLQIYQFEIIQNLLQQPEEASNNNIKQNQSFPKIRNTFELFMKNSQNSQRIINEKLKILTLLFNRSVISLFELEAYYSTIDLSNEVNYSLDICNELLLIELFIFSVSQNSKYHPRHSNLNYIFSLLEGHNYTYRNFDWNSFNFINLFLQHQNQTNADHQIGSNLPSQNNKQSQTSIRASKILKKISQQIKIYNTEKLVNQQKQILQKKKQIKEIEKFFIQIRVNQMQKLQTIIAPFNRLPHFSNIKEKIAINALSQKELSLQSYKLQKKLLNLMGWRVVNLNTAEFLEFSINQRLNFIALHLESENKEIKRIGGRQEMILYER